MRMSNQIRRWRQWSLCALLCLTMQAIVVARTDTPTPPPKPGQVSTTPASKTAETDSGNATAKHEPAHSSTHASAQKGKASQSKTSQSKTSHGKKVARKRGQQAIDSARAREIQTALIREHYLQGQPTGTWDSASQAAMQRYQADHGWQSKTTPDARALIKLGLGPSQDHLLNPESAMTATNASAGAQSGARNANSKTVAKPTPADSSLPKP
jgi:putative peptidoglycan binding protein